MLPRFEERSQNCPVHCILHCFYGIGPPEKLFERTFIAVGIREGGGVAFVSPTCNNAPIHRFEETS